MGEKLQKGNILAAIRQAIERDTLGHLLLLVCRDSGNAQAHAEGIARQQLCLTRAGEPCGTCIACSRPLRQHLDVLWLAGEPEEQFVPVAASAAIRQLADRGALLGGWRVVVLPHAERLTDSASNALLHVLEEPPERFLCILLVNSIRRVLPTIRSRAQIFHLPGLPGSGATPQRSLPEIEKKLLDFPENPVMDALLLEWQQLLHGQIRVADAIGRAAVQWRRIEHARQRLAAHVNSKLVVEALLSPSR